MKLKSAHVTNFRSILDSSPVEIEATTCLVGKNEAGKTAFLKALEGLNSVNKAYKYDRTRDYPRRDLSKYETLHGGEEATVVSTLWELDEDDLAALTDEFGDAAVTGSEITIRRSYGNNGQNWSIPVDEAAVLERLYERFGLKENDKKPLKDVTTTARAAIVLSKIEEPSEQQAQLLAHIKAYRSSRAIFKGIDILQDRVPAFLYFSHYDRMNGELSFDRLRQDQQQNTVDPGDQVFLDFLNYAGTDLDELANATEFEDLNSKCEAAANAITDEIFEYWTQNDQLEIQVTVGEGKADDSPPFNAGTVARARVRNNLHRVSVPFSERSAGFIWFFSFLVKFARLQEHQGDVIILLDEPGLTLHGTAQKDLLRYFKEKLEPKHQLIFTTHSPFMVPADNLSCVRTVEDVVAEDDRGRKKSEGTKIRGDVLATDPQTNFPILGAMGFELTQGLIIAPDTLLVEGPSDILYLQAVSKRLQTLGRTHLHPKWAICPASGIDKITPFVSLFRGNSLNMVVLTDFERSRRKRLDNLYKARLLEQERIILATEIAHQDEADIEDFFHPELFAQLVNETYGLEGDHLLTAEKLDAADTNTARLVKKAEAYFRTLPEPIPMFSHFDPSAYLLSNPALLDQESDAVMATLDCFETAFQRIAAYS